MGRCSDESIRFPPLLLVCRLAQHTPDKGNALAGRLYFIALARNTFNTPGSLVAGLLQNVHRPRNIHRCLIALSIERVGLDMSGAGIAGALRPACLTLVFRPIPGVEQ